MAKLRAHGEEIGRWRDARGTEYAFMADRWVLVKRFAGERFKLFKRVTRVGESAELIARLEAKGFQRVKG